MDILIFIVALSILVLVHEFGHYFAAKYTGVKVEEFGLGLPPRAWGEKIGETIWSLNWLPIGGFCRMEGEDLTDQKFLKSKTSFVSKKPGQKALIVVGGVLMNLVLAVVIFTVVYSIIGIPVETDKVKVIGVAKGSPAEKAGLKEGDWVQSVNGVMIKKSSELTSEVGKFKGEIINLQIARGGQVQDLPVQKRENPPAGEGAMGVTISHTEMQKIKWYEFYRGIYAGFKEAYFWGKIIVNGVVQMVGTLLSGEVPQDVAGPLGMYEATSAIKKNQGILAVIHFFGIVSVNLAVVNILPFPALDGGRMIFVAYEMITRRRASQKLEAAVNSAGMLVLLTLIVAITVGDVVRIIQK